MQKSNLAGTGDLKWVIPDFSEIIYRPKTYDHVLVIPVINEGDRIQLQLKRIADAKLPVDVIIADGGSTDRSLDDEFIKTSSVRAVLTKTGPGRLGSQLRIAYAWSLKQDYTGIITIDGNGKDGVEAVSMMVDKLVDGYDYIQGSRYLPGGFAGNTPFERTIGNRLIHAPLLSLAGRYWFTDTTNGFRAYSRKYLLHPQVLPFREVFTKYELLFYLTMRAGSLGLKVTEIPVSRTYPYNAKVPTKINGLSDKFELLSQVLKAAIGKYNP